MAVAQAEAMELPAHRALIRRHRHRQPPRREPDGCRREHRAAVGHARAGRGRARGTGRDHGAARAVRGPRWRAVPVQPPGALQLLVAARGHDHRLRPGPPAPDCGAGAPRHAGQSDIQRHQVHGRGRQPRDPDRVRPGARGAARHSRARARRPRGDERARQTSRRATSCARRRSTCWSAAWTRAHPPSTRSAR